MPTFAQQQVTRLETLLAANVGLKNVTVGNTSVAYEDLEAQYEKWKSKVARENGTRPRVASINLRNF
jgi:3-deoxy-D-arabino-heptulosonate 7-phosphate (DAHP) synthase